MLTVCLALTDELYQRCRMKKLTIDNSAGQWDSYNRQVLEFLSIPLVPEQVVFGEEAIEYAGTYRDERTDREIAVEYENQELLINLWEKVRSRLIREVERVFCAEGWPFEIVFGEGDSGRIDTMKVAGKDVGYLSLVGTIASKHS